jgi:hypothetical protein
VRLNSCIIAISLIDRQIGSRKSASGKFSLRLCIERVAAQGWNQASFDGIWQPPRGDHTRCQISEKKSSDFPEPQPKTNSLSQDFFDFFQIFRGHREFVCTYRIGEKAASREIGQISWQVWKLVAVGCGE